MIEVAGRLCLWSGGNGSWHFFTVPEEQSAEIRAHCLMTMRGFRSARVEATINDVTWRTSVFPLKSGGYILPVKSQVRRQAGISAEDDIIVRIELI
jgi:hypothetical protein